MATFLRVLLTVGAVLALQIEKCPAQVEQPPNYAAMIEALASKNSKPEQIDGKPLFLRNFDWEDQRRVAEAFSKLRHDGSEELWEELLKHLDDERYSLTMEFNGSGIGVNYSVGGLCRKLAYKHLAEDVLDHYVRVGRPVKVIKELWPDLAEWRQARAEKSLCELQIEVCELGLQELPKLKHLAFVDDDHREKIRSEIESQRDDLKRTKKAVFRPMILDSYAFYGKNTPNPPKAKAKPKTLKAE